MKEHERLAWHYLWLNNGDISAARAYCEKMYHEGFIMGFKEYSLVDECLRAMYD